MILGSERRRFSRVKVTLEVQYCTSLAMNGEMHCAQGVIQDFSLNGAYFFSEPSIPLAPGQILTLSISTSLPHLDQHNTSHIQAKGEVVRLEPAEPASQQRGIAVTFLEDPTFASLSGFEA